MDRPLHEPSDHPPRIGAVSYLNMLPLVAGLAELGATVHLDTPARLARALASAQLDLAMAPVAAVFQHPDWRILGSMAIGARGPVHSVLLMGSNPPTAWRRLRPDSHSRSSNALAQVLLRRAMGLGIELAEPLPESGWTPPPRATPGEAFLLIGSRALRWRDHWPDAAEAAEQPEPPGCIMDLGQAWTNWTGLPFVFAVWVARPGFEPADWAERLDALARRNLARIDELVAAWPGLADERLTPAQAADYLRHAVRYELDDAARRGLRRFYDEGRALDLFPAGWPDDPHRS